MALCMPMASLYAQDTEQGAAQEPKTGGIERIQVSAQKRMQSINEVGITMNAFSGDQIRELGVQTSTDLAAFTPGLTINDGGGTGVPVYTIRGVGFQDTKTTSSSSTVGLYFDEVSMPYAIMTRGALFDVQRVEVLKGPQGDLFGRNTTAGQINYISNKPSDDFGYGGSASYSSFQTFDLEGYVTGALTDTTQARFAFKTTQSNEGWQESLTRPGDTLGEKDIKAFRATVNFDLSEDATLLVRVHHSDDQSDNQAPTAYDGSIVGLDYVDHLPTNEYVYVGGAHYGETPPWWSVGDNRAADWSNGYVSGRDGETADLRPRRDNQLSGISAKLEIDFEGMTLTSITSYDDFQRNEANDVDGMAAAVQNTINESDITVFAQEIRLSGETDEFSWIGGLYYSEDDADEFYNFFMDDSRFAYGATGGPFKVFPINRLHTRYSQQSDSKAIFGHVEYNLTDAMSLTVGARYTQEHRDWSGCTYDANGSYSALWGGFFGATIGTGACSTLDDTAGSATNISQVLGTPNINDAFHVYETSISTNKWMGKISLDYDLSDDALIYATYSSGFKSGGFNGNNSNTTSQLRPYKPEELEAYEIGLKSTLFDNTLQLNASTFFYDYKNKQETERTITPVGAISGLGNVPKSEITGAEIEVTWAPVDGLFVNLGAAYLDTEIKEWNTPLSGSFDFSVGQPKDVVYLDASGSGLPQAPKWSYNLLARYEWSLSDDLLMNVAGDINFTDDQPNPVSAKNSLEQYSVANIRAGISDNSGDWAVTLWVRNVADEYYFNGAFGGINGAYARAVGMPRTVGITVDYSFN